MSNVAMRSCFQCLRVFDLYRLGTCCWQSHGHVGVAAVCCSRAFGEVPFYLLPLPTTPSSLGTETWDGSGEVRAVQPCAPEDRKGEQPSQLDR